MSDDGVRRNIAEVSDADRIRLRNAILELNARKYQGGRNDQPLAGGVSYWFKQDEIHQATHVHGGPGFLPWHREIVNRFEALLREIDPGVSLHYWDWRTDPVNGPVDLFTQEFMGEPHGEAQNPWLDGKFYDPTAALFRSDDPFDAAHSNPADPPKSLTRQVSAGVPGLGPSDEEIVAAETFPQMSSENRGGLEFAHDNAHGYIGGNLGFAHISFRDPFVFLLHSNVDRIFASWQLQSGKEWRLDPEDVYGDERDTKATGEFPNGRPGILTPLEPWAGLNPQWDGPKPDDPEKGAKAARPWAPPENGEDHPAKNSRHPSVVEPPLYDKYVRVSAGGPAVESLQLVGASPDGKVWHTWRNPDGSWQTFGDVTGRAEVAAGQHPGPLSALSCSGGVG